MIRKIIHIDEEKCNGCGLCANACHEGAIDIIDGKAKLVRENFCDGFGDCLPNCPTGAITFEEREAAAYDEQAVKKAQEAKKMEEMKHEHHHEGGCPGSLFMDLKKEEAVNGDAPQAPVYTGKPVSRLNQWPCQIKLLPTQAPFFDGAKLLIAADCTAYVYANMHEDFMKGKITIIGCPKLMRWTTRRSLPRSSAITISKASPSSAWRSPAAAACRERRKTRCKQAESSSPGRS